MSYWLWQSSAPFSALGRLHRQALAVCPSKTSSSWLVAQRSVVQAVARIVGLDDILGISWLRQFQLTTFVKHLEEGFDFVVLERVFDLGPVYETTPSWTRARSLLRVGCQG